MNKKETPISIVAIVMLMCCIIFSMVVLFNITKEEKEKEITFVIEEPTAPKTVTVPQALIDMPKPDPKPIYTRQILTPVEMLCKTSAKTYMDYRSITDHSSAQYNLIHSDEIEICEDGFLRDKDGYIGVAMGWRFGPIGSKYICHLDNGKDIKVIKVEAKAECDSINGFCGSTSYDIIEFVIDTRAEWMRNNICGNDYIFCGNFNNYEEMNGTIISIDRVEN